MVWVAIFCSALSVPAGSCVCSTNLFFFLLHSGAHPRVVADGGTVQRGQCHVPATVAGFIASLVHRRPFPHRRYQGRKKTVARNICRSRCSPGTVSLSVFLSFRPPFRALSEGIEPAVRSVSFEKIPIICRVNTILLLLVCNLPVLNLELCLFLSCPATTKDHQRQQRLGQRPALGDDGDAGDGDDRRQRRRCDAVDVARRAVARQPGGQRRCRHRRGLGAAPSTRHVRRPPPIIRLVIGTLRARKSRYSIERTVWQAKKTTSF